MTTDTATANVTELLAEEKIGLAEAGRLVAYDPDHQVHPTTVSRWCQKGVVLPGGRRVRLEHLRIGGRLITTKQAVARFLAAQLDPADPATPAATPGERQRASDRAARELERMGA